MKELSVDILQQTIAAVRQNGKFCLQLDETTGIGNNAQLILYHDADDYVEQFIFCRHQLTKNTTGEEIFKNVDSFFCELTVCLLVLMVLHP